MDNIKLITIVLIHGENIDPLVTKKLQENNVTIMDQRNTWENASESGLNDSKFCGMLSVEALLGKNLAIVNAETFMNKKNNLSFVSTLVSRIKGIKLSLENFNFITIMQKDYKYDEQKEIKKMEIADHFFRWSLANSEIMTVDNFLKYEITAGTPIKGTIKVTCGLVGKTVKDTDETQIVGHKTVGYGIDLESSNVLFKEWQQHIGKSYDSNIVGLVVNEKEGGRIIHIPALGTTAHFTVNTSIKAFLSGAVLEKFNNSIFEFKLSEIDNTVKEDKDKSIVIKKVADTVVEVTGWYVYAI